MITATHVEAGRARAAAQVRSTLLQRYFQAWTRVGFTRSFYAYLYCGRRSDFALQHGLLVVLCILICLKVERS